jgi:hypothetical protein
MKKTLVALLFCALGGLAYGQGQVTVSTSKTACWMRFSNTVLQAWAGQSTSPGNAANAAIEWGLYYGSDKDHLNNLLVGGTLYQGTTAGFMGTIYESAGTKTLSTAGRVSTAFQLRAWSAGYASWDAAKNSGDASAVYSVLTETPVITVAPGDPTQSPPDLPALIKWGSSTVGQPGNAAGTAMIVELVPVPEPSIIALAGLGLAGLIFIRRRK